MVVGVLSQVAQSGNKPLAATGPPKRVQCGAVGPVADDEERVRVVGVANQLLAHIARDASDLPRRVAPRLFERLLAPLPSAHSQNGAHTRSLVHVVSSRHRRNTIELLKPPKPRALTSTTSIGISRGSRTRSSPSAGIGSSRFPIAGTTPSRIASSAVATLSAEPP